MIIDRREVYTISPFSVKKLIQYYIPKELLPLEWDCTDKNPLKNIQNLIDASNGRLIVYGTAAEILESLNILWCFPGSHEKFGFNIADYYGYEPAVCKSMKQNSYHYKRDYFVSLQWAMTTSPLRRFETEVSTATVMCYLKMRERLLPTLHEMAPFCQTTFQRFILKIVTLYKERKTFTPVVRIFDVKPNKLIMAHELLLVMKQEQMDVSSFEKEVLAMSKLATFTYQEVASRVSKKELRKIEFVIIKITSAKFSPTPIPTITPGRYSVLAYHFFYNLVTNMITAKKMFRSMNPSQFHLVEEFFNFFDDYFDMTKGVTFIDLKDVDEINEKMETLYKSLTNSCEEPTEIRDLGKKGFTNEDLAKELIRLKLDRIFPDICEQSKIYFEKMKAKRSKTLSTLGVCGLIHQIQIDGLARRIPKIGEFIHSQLACSLETFGYCCEDCSDAQDPQISKAEPVEVEISSIKISPEEPEETKEIELELESVSNEEKSQEPSNDLKTSKPKKAKKSRQSEQTTAKPEERESNACPKCFRASEYNIKLREDLRLEKIETKHLRKSLKQAQQESEEKSSMIAEKNEEIQQLKAQLQAQQIVMAKNLGENVSTPVEENIPGRSAEETEKAEMILHEMLETQKILETENPMNKITTMTSKLSEASLNRENKVIAKCEFIYFERQIRGYTKEVENRIKIIRSNQEIRSDQIPELRDFPTFCGEFLKAYKDTFKGKTPLICAQLLKTPEPPNELDDNECLVCLDEMKEEHETLKCLDCKRKYHTGCAQKWFKVKRICPTCDAGLLDDNEFPALS